jgi:hypothetical protein
VYGQTSTFNLQGSSFNGWSYYAADILPYFHVSRFDVQTGNNYTTQPIKGQNPSGRFFLDVTKKLVFTIGTNNVSTVTNNENSIFVFNYTNLTIAPELIKICGTSFLVTKILVDRGMGTIYLVNKTMIYNYNWNTCTLGSMLTSVWNESTKVLPDAFRVTSGGVAVFLDPTYCLKFLNLRTDTFEAQCVNTSAYTYPWTQYGDMMLGMDTTNDEIFFQRLKFNNDLSNVFLIAKNNNTMLDFGQTGCATGFDAVSQNGKRYVTHEFSGAFPPYAITRTFKLAPATANTAYIFPNTKTTPSYKQDDTGISKVSGTGGLPVVDFSYPTANLTKKSSASGTYINMLLLIAALIISIMF